MPQSCGSPATACRSSRSSAARDIAAISFARLSRRANRRVPNAAKLARRYLPFLDEQWAAGCRNGAELWRRLKPEASGDPCALSANGRRGGGVPRRAADQQLQKVPSARTIARLMTTARDHLSKADTVTIAAIEAAVPMLVEAHALVDRFHAMIRKKVAAVSSTWIADASAASIASLATGITKDKGAGPRRNHRALVERSDRGPDHQAQAGEAPDVRPRKARSPSGKADRCGVNQTRHRICVRANFGRLFTS